MTLERARKAFRTKLLLGGGVLGGCDSVEKSGKPYRIAVVRPSGEMYNVTIEKSKSPVGGSVSHRSAEGPTGHPMNIEIWDDVDE